MKNIKVTLQYEGTKYQGWQRQESTDNTIQGRLEQLLFKMCGKKVEVHGSGRTDAGVHALGQIANFQLDTKLTAAQVMEYMNTYLPEDIAVIAAEEMPLRFHSRLGATGKVYKYRVLNSSVPHIFERRYVYEHRAKLDVEAMQKAAAIFEGKHDFKAFTSNKRSKKSTVRTMSSIKVERAGDEIWITYQGDGFLYHMARILTGTLLEVGRGEKTAADAAKLLQFGKREEAGELVPAKGLTLVEVSY